MSNSIASATIVPILFGIAFAAARAESAEGGADAIEEIQVTATRRARSVSETSAAVTLIAAEEIAAMKLTTDALAAQAGVFLQQTTPGQGAAILRGLKGSELLHVVDGMRLNNAIFRNAPTQYLALVAPGSVSRIEVVRGAPTSLYGSDAVGGVVQVLSRIPEFDSATVGWRGEAHAVFDSGELGKSVGATVESGTERVAGLLSASYLETGNRRTGSGSRVGPSAYTANSFRAALSLGSPDTGSWLIDYQFARQPDTPRVDELVPGFGETEPASSEFQFKPNERQFAHLRYLQEDGAFGVDWRFDAGWQKIVDDRLTRNFGSAQRRREFNSSDLSGVSLTASSEGGFGSWIAGVEGYYDEVASSRFETDITTDLTVETPSRFPDGARVRQAAVFGNTSLSAGPRNSVSLGLRVSSVDVELPSTSVSVAANIEETDLSGDVGWSFDVNDRVQVVANIGYGFRAPNVFDVGTLGERPGNRFNIPNAELESERAIHYDLGLRFYSERVRWELTLFQLNYRDRITSVLTGEVTPDGRDIVQSQNQSSADIRGAEFGGTWQLAADILIDAVINYTWGEQSDGLADRIPPLNGRVSLRMDRASTSYAASVVFADRQDRLSARDIRDIRINPAGTAGWGILNFRFDWRATENLKIALRAENLFDKQYRVHGSGLDAVGRNFIGELRYSW